MTRAEQSEAWGDRQPVLVRMAAEGKTGSEIAAAFGVTRSAVLGRAHRTGVKLSMDDRKAKLRGRRLREKRPRMEKVSKKFPLGHPARRSRPWGQRAFSEREIATAIAARLAGMSYNKAARIVGASAQSLAKHWMKDPRLMTLGRALFEVAREDAAVKAAAARGLAAFEAEARRVSTERVNGPILSRMPERSRAMLEARIAGETLREIGKRFGVTRERVRQIEVRWRMEGLVIPSARPLNREAATKLMIAMHIPGYRQSKQKARPPRDFYAVAAGLLKKQTRNLSDAERQRRADHMRAVSRAYWDARA